ncbi:MAG: HEAT repeat domain-containing protein [Planctomycetaceae bacterium]|nr:HEAT repeat domain-containing protein [Planctomycetaceae bacterium]MCA9045887.1 HEAT repeat domain-containing protein [Planctomycetaceae bacterium]
MSDSYPSAASEDAPKPQSGPRVEDLPPVEPPSAGFIVQLFVVPAIIVLAVCGVYFLFARAASTEHDWRQLVADVKSENPHVRWRAALGLAQALEADGRRQANRTEPLEAGVVPLAENKEVAEALAEMYGDLIQLESASDEQANQIDFLSKALGLVDVDDVSLPILRDGLSEERSEEVQRHSMTGLVMIAGRRFEKGTPLKNAELEGQILELSREPKPLVRHQTAFLLGLMPSEAALERIHELLDDGDQITQVNAAVALARNDSLDGFSVFEDVLSDAVDWKLNPAQVETEEQRNAYFERGLMLDNSVRALTQLAPQLSGGQKASLVEALDAAIASTKDDTLTSAMKNLKYELQREKG